MTATTATNRNQMQQSLPAKPFSACILQRLGMNARKGNRLEDGSEESFPATRSVRGRRPSSLTMLLLLLIHVVLLPSSVYEYLPMANGFRVSYSFHRQLEVFTHFKRIENMCGRLYAKSGTKKKKSPGSKMVAVNRIAYRNYEVLDTLEAGISLLGTEVKSIRDGKLNLRDGYVRPSKNGRSCTLHNVHIGKCSQVGADYFQHEEKRPRALLVHKSEARKFMQQTEQQGMTIIPLKAYWNDDNKLKIQVALCRGKNVRDKRVAIQERDMKRETNRIIKNFRIQ
jgi:SsrA-binding protein